MAAYLSWAPWTHQGLCQCSQWFAVHTHTHTLTSGNAPFVWWGNEQPFPPVLKHSCTFSSGRSRPLLTTMKNTSLRHFDSSFVSQNQILWYSSNYIDSRCFIMSVFGIWIWPGLRQFFSLMCIYWDTVWKFCLLTFACNCSQSHSDEESCQKSLKPDSDTEKVHV